MPCEMGRAGQFANRNAERFVDSACSSELSLGDAIGNGGLEPRLGENGRSIESAPLNLLLLLLRGCLLALKASFEHCSAHDARKDMNDNKTSELCVSREVLDGEQAMLTCRVHVVASHHHNVRRGSRSASLRSQRELISTNITCTLLVSMLLRTATPTEKALTLRSAR